MGGKVSFPDILKECSNILGAGKITIPFPDSDVFFASNSHFFGILMTPVL